MDLWISAVRRDVYTPHITTSVPNLQTDTPTDILAVFASFFLYLRDESAGHELTGTFTNFMYSLNGDTWTLTRKN